MATKIKMMQPQSCKFNIPELPHNKNNSTISSRISPRKLKNRKINLNLTSTSQRSAEIESSTSTSSPNFKRPRMMRPSAATFTQNLNVSDFVTTFTENSRSFGRNSKIYNYYKDLKSNKSVKTNVNNDKKVISHNNSANSDTIKFLSQTLSQQPNNFHNSNGLQAPAPITSFSSNGGSAARSFRPESLTLQASVEECYYARLKDEPVMPRTGRNFSLQQQRNCGQVSFYFYFLVVGLVWFVTIRYKKKCKFKVHKFALSSNIFLMACDLFFIAWIT